MCFNHLFDVFLCMLCMCYWYLKFCYINVFTCHLLYTDINSATSLKINLHLSDVAHSVPSAVSSIIFVLMTVSLKMCKHIITHTLLYLKWEAATSALKQKLENPKQGGCQDMTPVSPCLCFLPSVEHKWKRDGALGTLEGENEKGRERGQLPEHNYRV